MAKIILYDKFWTTMIGLLIINLLLGIVIFYNFKLLSDSNHIHISVGDEINPELGKDAEGSLIKLHDDKWNLLLYIDLMSYRDKRIAKYSNILYERYLNKDFEIIGIAQTSQDNIDNFIQMNDISYSIYSVNNIGNIPHLEQYNGFTLIDKFNKVRFVASLNEEYMRQTVERYLLDSITYLTDLNYNNFNKGDYFTNILIKDLESGTIVRLNEILNSNSLLFIFTSSCASCSIWPYLQKYLKLENILREYSNSKGQLPIVIFSSKLPESKIQNYIKSTNIFGKVLLAKEEISGVESLYYSTYLPLNNEVVAFSLNSNGTIYDIKYLSDFNNE